MNTYGCAKHIRARYSNQSAENEGESGGASSSAAGEVMVTGFD